MTILRFLVPGTPHPKARHRYRIVKRKGSAGTSIKDYFPIEYADPDTEREEARIAAYCHKAMLEQHFDRVDEGPIALFALAVFKIPASCSKAEAARRIFHTQKPDDDNVRKILDGINGIAWGDDAQVSFGPPMKVWSLAEESLHVWVVPLTQDVLSFDTMATWTDNFIANAKAVAMRGREQQIGINIEERTA